MKILILNWRDIKNPKSGGAEIVTMEHAKFWIKKGHQVTWFTSRFKGSKDKEKLERVNIVRRGNFITVYLLAPFFYFFSGYKFDLVIDQIHGLPFFTPLYVRKPKLVLIHEVAREIWDYMFPFPVNRIGKFIEPLYFKLYKNIQFWTDADSTIDDLVKMGIKKKNCIAINCPINNKVLNKLPEKEKNPTFIFVSRVVKMKGIDEVVRAFSYILEDLKDAKLWIVGDGDKKYVNELKETMKSYSISTKVKFFGKVDDNKKLELMQKAHLLLHASVKEGWGLVVIEAASQGTPSVVYNVSGLKDSVINGETGIVIAKNTPSEMGERAIELLNSKEKYVRFQKNGLEWAKSLTWEKATKQSEALLNEVLRSKNEVE
ncbi:MAG: glycosyltransferase family 4 protein [Patescibacteria group bacterium]